MKVRILDEINLDLILFQYKGFNGRHMLFPDIEIRQT